MEDEVSSFWGPVTSSIECCEKNYVHSAYVAELYNTISNVPCILLALLGLINCLWQRCEKRFSVLYMSNLILTIGSMLYHATLQHMFQQSDETPLVWEMLLYIYILYSPDWHYRSTIPTFIFLYGAVFGIFHFWFELGISFKIHFVILCLLCAPRAYKYYLYTDDIKARWLAKFYVGTLIVGSLCWLCDRLFCKTISDWSINPQGHALWHLCMGFSSYFANTFLVFCRAQQRGWTPKIVNFLGFLPYVRIERKPKSQ